MRKGLIAVSAVCVLSLGTAAFAADAGAHKTDKTGGIPYWTVLGAIPIPAAESGGAGIDKEYLKGETSVMPVAGEKVTINEKTYEWKLGTIDAASRVLDGDKTFGGAQNVVIYMVAYVSAEREITARASWGSDDSAAVYINGKEAGRFVGGRGCSQDQNQTGDVALRKGINAVMMKVLNGGGGYGGCLRLTDGAGKALKNLPIVAAPEGKQAPAKLWPTIAEPLGSLRVFVDQIGYRLDGRKIAIVANSAPLSSEASIEIRDAVSGKVGMKLSPAKPPAFVLFADGRKDGESGDYVGHFDFTDFKQPGRYVIVYKDEDFEAKSYGFNIAENVYRDAGLAVWRSLYFQRADTELPEKYAGPWAHKADHRGTNQATQARVYQWKGNAHWDPVGTNTVDPTPHDVSGSWWDAGNFDKYIGNTHQCHNDLLMGCLLIGNAAKDGDLNIPESGNGFPDLLDEVRYSTDWFIRMGDETGATWGRVYEKPSSPPEKDTSPVMLTEQTSGATMNRCSALALAAYVWKEVGKDEKYSRKCLNEAMKSWKLLEEKPHPWPADPKDPKKARYTGEWYFWDFNVSRTLAAVCLFALTGDAKYDAIVRENYAKFKYTDKKGMADGGDLWPAIWIYMRAKGADPELIAKMKEQVIAGADAVVNAAGNRRGYRMAVGGFWWGSNCLVGRTGAHCLFAAELTDDPAKKQKYIDTAEEYVHYLFGRNPLGLCWFTNMKQFGAENSIMLMFHSWLGNDGLKDDPYAGKFIGEGPNKIGPPPGYVVGGPNGHIKRYVMGLHWTQSPWEFNEPCLSYQGTCCMLTAYFVYKAK